MNKGAKKKYLKVKFVRNEDITDHIVHVDNIKKDVPAQLPSTPKRRKEIKSQTPSKAFNSPTTGGRTRQVHGTPTTPRRILSSKDAQTPRMLRQQVRNQVAKRLEETHSATLEDTDEEEEVEENQSGDEENVDPKPKIATPSSTLKQQQPGVAANGTSYFHIHSRRCQTSNHTLALLGRDMDQLMSLPRMLADTTPTPHRNAVDLQAKYCRNYFPHWYHLLREGFNVLLYGFGSKLNLMENFCTQYLADHDHLLIHGFFPGLTIKHILNSITLEILEHSKSYTSVPDQLNYILQYYNEAESEELYLVLANIDGPNLRSDKAQSILCQLAACPHIHLLASVDHVNAPLMWDQVKLGRLRWVWTNVTDPTSRYLGETAYEDSQQATTGSRLALSSLTHVFSSLPSNTRKIFLILVRHQLEQLSSKHRSYLGMAFQELVEESKEAFLVNSQLTIRAHLSEFKDHRVIIVRKGADGTEYLYIPLDSAILEEFVEQASVD